MAILFHHSGVDLEQEDDDAGFLGVQNEHNESGLPKMKQEGLIDHVIEALVLDIGTVIGKATPAEANHWLRIQMEKLHMGTLVTAVLWI